MRKTHSDSHIQTTTLSCTRSLKKKSATQTHACGNLYCDSSLGHAYMNMQQRLEEQRETKVLVADSR